MHRADCQDRMPDGLCDDLSAGCIGLGQDDDEFFSAEARRDVAGAANVGVERAGDGAEHFIAPSMAVLIVELLEEVRVDIQQGQRRARADRLAPLALERLAKRATVRQARQIVGSGNPSQLGLGLRAATQFALEEHRQSDNGKAENDRHETQHESFPLPRRKDLLHGERNGENERIFVQLLIGDEAAHAIDRRNRLEGARSPLKEALNMGRGAEVPIDPASVEGVPRQQDAVVAKEIDRSMLAKAQVLEQSVEGGQGNRAHHKAGKPAIGIGIPSADADAEFASSELALEGAAYVEPEVLARLVSREEVPIGDVQGTWSDDGARIGNQIAVSIDDQQRSHERRRGRAVEKHPVLKIGRELSKSDMAEAFDGPFQGKVQQFEIVVEIP